MSKVVWVHCVRAASPSGQIASLFLHSCLFQTNICPVFRFCSHHRSLMTASDVFVAFLAPLQRFFSPASSLMPQFEPTILSLCDNMDGLRHPHHQLFAPSRCQQLSGCCGLVECRHVNFLQPKINIISYLI